MNSNNSPASGYLFSAMAFLVMTGLWVFMVRGDPYYGMTTLFGFSVPVTTVMYLAVMPALGFWVGFWRYYSVEGRGGVAKLFARSVTFLYAHSLLSLFTVAMVIEYFFGWNMQRAVQQIDDNLFDLISRYAPWLCAYLAAFNFGRYFALRGAANRGGHQGHPGMALAGTMLTGEDRGQPPVTGSGEEDSTAWENHDPSDTFSEGGTQFRVIRPDVAARDAAEEIMSSQEQADMHEPIEVVGLTPSAVRPVAAGRFDDALLERQEGSFAPGLDPQTYRPEFAKLR